jgi:hypothetical protein
MSPRRRGSDRGYERSYDREYDRGAYDPGRAGRPPWPGGPEPDGVTRPFLSQLRSPAERPDEPEPPPDAVRPYLLTGGRVPDDVGGFETVYVITSEGVSRLSGLAFERRAIAELCREAQSVAEISALLRLPLGVATVLTLDLAGEGFLTSSGAADPGYYDPDLILRLIHGVRAL